jgi:hypothetical protein
MPVARVRWKARGVEKRRTYPQQFTGLLAKTVRRSMPLTPLRNLLERAWESLTEGWRELLTQSSGALTHFGSEDGKKNESAQEFPQWGLLAAETWETAISVVIRVEIPV